MKVIITGATGLLGRALSRELSTPNDVVGTGLHRAAGAVRRLDLLDPKAVTRFLRDERPRVIIHAAAERRPDVSENDPEATRALNVEATRTIAAAAAGIGAWLVYFSTDYVFDGTSPPYAPDATPNPLNFYARTKLAGEDVVRRSADHCILRVPVLYGQIESLEESPVTAIASDLIAGGEVKLDHWATRYPTFSGDVAVVVRQLVEEKRRNADFAGTFHWSGDEALTKYDMARVIAAAWGLPSGKLIPVPDPPTGAPRPRNSQLDCSALERIGAGRRTPFKESVIACLEPFRPS